MTGPRYFATAGRNPACWLRHGIGTLTPYPAGARYGPRLLERDIPVGLPPDARRDIKLDWYSANVTPWLRHAHAEVDAEPLAAAARFARATGRCCVCAARLQDHPARLTGTCTGCRGRLTPDTLTDLVSRSHLAPTNLGDN